MDDFSDKSLRRALNTEVDFSRGMLFGVSVVMSPSIEIGSCLLDDADDDSEADDDEDEDVEEDAG